MRIYVTNLRAEVTDEDLKAHFEVAGEVRSAMVVKTKTTNEPTGLGFIDMVDESAAFKAYNLLKGKLLKGSPLKLHDRRDVLERRSGSERRIEFEQRITTDRRAYPRRKATGEEEIVSLFVDLDRREHPERREGIGKRVLDKRRGKMDRRENDDRRIPYTT
ncbi:MAG: hypothetical protein IIA58_02130 [Candidatus Marinimicrobia bacterium]|nr:hypothetical protein [Candidatus Neomarinimicrobiota bacterium]